MKREREDTRALREIKDTREETGLMGVRESRGSPGCRAAKGLPVQTVYKENKDLKETLVLMDQKEEKVKLAATAAQEDLVTTALLEIRVTEDPEEPMGIKAREEMMDHQDQTAHEEIGVQQERRVNRGLEEAEDPEESLVSLVLGVSRDERDQQDPMETQVRQEELGLQVIVVMRVLQDQRALKDPEGLKEPPETEV